MIWLTMTSSWKTGCNAREKEVKCQNMEDMATLWMAGEITSIFLVGLCSSDLGKEYA